ncbi:MAG: phosphatidate cytidylyltransferase [Planktomarina sp.]
MSKDWSDLKARVLSSIGMTILGIGAIIIGGVWFQMLAVFAIAVMVWELWMMIEPERPTPGMLIAAVAASLLSGIITAEKNLIVFMFLILPVIGAVTIRRERRAFFLFSLAMLLCGWALVSFREEQGLIWLLWLIGVVVITDVFGYFAGRTLGGPKFWPAISPKKTWSGTLAGWVGAAILGAALMPYTNAGFSMIWISVLLSFASQMGDIAESALKRRMTVKDSSTLIPGHGGLFDRFDGLLGATLAMLLAAQFTAVPEVLF